MESIEILGVRIHTLSKHGLMDYITDTINKRQRAIVAYANVHAINLAQTLPWFKDFLNGVEVVFCDGFGIRWGAMLLGTQAPQRFTPPDFFPSLCRVCIENDFSLFFLGARPGVARQAGEQLTEEFHGLTIKGTHHGYFLKERSSPENQTVVSMINDAQPDILIVGFGMPLQEQWINDNWDRIDCNIVLTAGALFDYLSGNVYRAPRWLTDRGLEWLGRLIIEPRRLWKRYLIGNPLFILRILRHRWRDGSNTSRI